MNNTRPFPKMKGRAISSYFAAISVYKCNLGSSCQFVWHLPTSVLLCPLTSMFSVTTSSSVFLSPHALTISVSLLECSATPALALILSVLNFSWSSLFPSSISPLSSLFFLASLVLKLSLPQCQCLAPDIRREQWWWLSNMASDCKQSLVNERRLEEERYNVERSTSFTRYQHKGSESVDVTSHGVCMLIHGQCGDRREWKLMFSSHAFRGGLSECCGL